MDDHAGKWPVIDHQYYFHGNNHSIKEAESINLKHPARYEIEYKWQCMLNEVLFDLI